MSETEPEIDARLHVLRTHPFLAGYAGGIATAVEQVHQTVEALPTDVKPLVEVVAEEDPDEPAV